MLHNPSGLLKHDSEKKICCRGDPWNWAGPATCMGVQLINCFILLYAYSCVIMHVYECVWERPHACHSYQGIPLGASGGEECHNKPKFCGTQTPHCLSDRCSKCQTRLNISDLFGIRGRWRRRAGWTGIKRNTQNTVVATSPLIFSPSAHRVLVGCICVGSAEMHRAFKHGWSSLRRTALLPAWKDVFAVIYKSRFFAAATSPLSILSPVCWCAEEVEGGSIFLLKKVNNRAENY